MAREAAERSDVLGGVGHAEPHEDEHHGTDGEYGEDELGPLVEQRRERDGAHRGDLTADRSSAARLLVSPRVDEAVYLGATGTSFPDRIP